MAVFIRQRYKALLQIKLFCLVVECINKYSVYAHRLRCQIDNPHGMCDERRSLLQPL